MSKRYDMSQFVQRHLVETQGIRNFCLRCELRDRRVENHVGLQNPPAISLCAFKRNPQCGPQGTRKNFKSAESQMSFDTMF